MANEISNSPQPVDEPLSSLLTTGQTPYLMTGQLLHIVRRLFVDPNNIMDDSLKGVLWVPDARNPNIGDPIKSKILIEVVHKWNGTDDDIQKRPAILIKRNAFRRIKLGVNDEYQLHCGDNSGDKYECILEGSHTYFCVGSTSGECETLATELYTNLIQFTPAIRKDLKVHKFEVMDIGTVGILEESKQKFVCPITVYTAFSMNWTLNLEAPALKTIALNFT